MFQRLFLAGLVAGGAACAPDEAAPAATGTGAAAEAPAGSASSDLADVTNYRLTMDKMDRFYDAQLEIARRVKELPPAEREALDAGSGDASLDDMARRLDSHAATREGLRAAGVSSREFATLMMAMVQAGMAASVMQMRPADDQDSLARAMNASMENIRFLQENEAELTRKQQELEAELRAMGALDASGA